MNYRGLEGKKIVVFYLGDHDPSGIDMTRDIEDRLEMYSGVSDNGDFGLIYGEDLEVDRLALNWNQVEEWRPPENPAKKTDSRFHSYVLEFGEASWELDAVEPTTLARLVREAAERYRDSDLWNAAVERENEMRAELQDFAEGYDA